MYRSNWGARLGALGIAALWSLGVSAANIEVASPMPVAQAGHSATLLPGGQVLVLGGETADGPSNAGVLYDTASNRWTPTASMARARMRSSATLLLSGRVLVTGGVYTGSAVTTESELYDPASGTWSPGTHMSTAREGHTTTRLSSGDVLVIGGVGVAGAVQVAEQYSPASNTWRPVGTLQAGRVEHTATLLADGNVLVAGGTLARGTEAVVLAEQYSPTSGTWSPAAPMLHPRKGHTATRLANGRVLVVGGASSSGVPLATAELYDPSANTWTATGSLPEARELHSASLTPDGRVVVAGGRGVGGVVVDSVVAYDPTTGLWEPLPGLSVARAEHSATWLPNGALLMLGGRNGAGLRADAELLAVRDAGTVSDIAAPGITGNVTSATILPSGRVLVMMDGSLSGRIYDPATGQWSPTGNMAAARSLMSLTLLPSGQVLAAGGSNLNTVERYDEATNLWTPVAPMSVVHRAHQAVLLPLGQVLVIAGFSGTGEVAQVERYDPAANVWTTVAPIPDPRHYFTATLLPSGKVLVAGGFTNAGVTNSAYLYDPQLDTWTPTGPMAFPRNGHMATLLPTGKVLVIGGADGARNVQPQAEVYDPDTGLWSAAGTMPRASENGTATLLPSGRVWVAGGFELNPISTFFAQSQLYDPVGNRWLPGPSLATARGQHATALLSDGSVLVAGGVNRNGFVTSAERYQEGLAPTPARQPSLTSANALSQFTALSATGAGFLPRLDASHGAANASPTNLPAFQVQRVDNGQMRFVAPDALTPLSDTAFTSSADAFAGFPAGPVLIRTWVNGVPSNAVYSHLAAIPGPVADTVATGGPLHAELEWTHAYTGGAPVTYVIRASNGEERSCTTPCDSLHFPLPPGDYQFTITPTNVAGSGPEADFGAPDTVVQDAVMVNVTPPASPVAAVPFTVDVQVSAATSDDFVPSGSVTVDAGGGAVCTIPALVDGRGQCDLTVDVAGSITLQVTYDGDTNFTEGSGSLAVTVGAPTLVVLPDALPGGQSGAAYPATSFTASGGTAPYSYAVTDGTLPAGLVLSPAGVLSGTPRAIGAFPFEVTATDADGFAGSVDVTLSIAAPVLTLTPANLPPATGGTAYSVALGTSGGVAPYTYALVGGALPAGMSLSGTGILAGTPTDSGSFTFRVRSTDSSGGSGPAVVERDFALAVGSPGIELTPPVLPNGQVGEPYAPVTLTASGGTAPYTFALSTGMLPAGLALSSSGVISGSAMQAGDAEFTVAATDANGFVGLRAYVLSIMRADATVSITSSRNPSTPGAAVTFTVAVTASDADASAKRQADVDATLAAPTGAVTFANGDTELAVIALDASGRATYTTSDLAPGTHVLTASYSGDANTAPAEAQFVQQVIEGGVAVLPQVVPATSSWAVWLLLAAVALLGVPAIRRHG